MPVREAPSGENLASSSSSSFAFSLLCVTQAFSAPVSVQAASNINPIPRMMCLLFSFNPTISNFNHPISVRRVSFGMRHLNNGGALFIQLFE